MNTEKIIVIDDNETFLEELEEMLFLTGYDVLGITESDKVVDVANKTKPDVILLDLRMKGKTGFEIAKELRRLPGTADVPIIAMSGYFSIDNESELLNKGFMRAFLKKPFEITDLITEIERVLAQKKQAQ